MRFLFIVSLVFCILCGASLLKKWKRQHGGAVFAQSNQAAADSKERLNAQIEMKEELLRNVHQSIQNVQANPPVCGGRKTTISVSSETNDGIAQLQKEIDELRAQRNKMN